MQSNGDFSALNGAKKAKSHNSRAEYALRPTNGSEKMLLVWPGDYTA